MSGAGMDLCILQFNGAIEDLYYQEQLKSRLVPLDRAICLFKLTVSVLLVASYAAGLAPTTTTATGIWMLYMALLAAQSLLITYLPAFYASHRSWLVLWFKFALASCLLGLIPSSVLQPADTVTTFAKMLFMGGGIVALNCTGMFIPVLFKKHVLFNVAMLVMFSSVLPSVADILLCSPTSRLLTSSLFNSVDNAAQHFCSLLLPLPAVATALAGLNAMEQQPAAIVRAQAYALLLWLQLFAGLLIPSIYIYCCELRSRTSFLLKLARTHSGMSSSAAVSQALGSGAPAGNSTSANSTSTSGGGGGAAAAGDDAGYDSLLPTAGRIPHFYPAGVYSLMPHQPLLLLVTLLLLVAVVLWSVLVLCSGWLAGAIDGIWHGGWVERTAAQAFAGSCIPNARG